MSTDLKTLKRDIVSSVKNLDRSDYMDICMLIKSNMTQYPMVNETPRGTFINLDMLEEAVVHQLHDMITTKLQRIAQR